MAFSAEITRLLNIIPSVSPSKCLEIIQKEVTVMVIFIAVVLIQAALVRLSFSVDYFSQGVIFLAGAWVFPAGNLDCLTGNLSMIPRLDVVFLYFPPTANEMYRK